MATDPLLNITSIQDLLSYWEGERKEMVSKIHFCAECKGRSQELGLRISQLRRISNKIEDAQYQADRDNKE